MTNIVLKYSLQLVKSSKKNCEQILVNYQMRVTMIEKLTPERIFRYFDHLSAGNLKTDNLQVLENEVREGPDEAVVDEQVLDDRVRAGVRTQSLRQKRKIY